MVDKNRLIEELRVLRMKNEKLLSKRAFENFLKRFSYLKAIQLGLSPDPDKYRLNEMDNLEMSYLKEYFQLFEEKYPSLKRKWESSNFWP